MRNTKPKPTTTKKYIDSSRADVNELAEKWVEILIEMLMTKKAGGLQKCNKFPKLESA